MKRKDMGDLKKDIADTASTLKEIVQDIYHDVKVETQKTANTLDDFGQNVAAKTRNAADDIKKGAQDVGRMLRKRRLMLPKALHHQNLLFKRKRHIENNHRLFLRNGKYAAVESTAWKQLHEEIERIIVIKENVKKLLDEQINAEYYSAYLYFAMSAYCDQTGYKGFASWMNIQAKEELAHGTHIFEHMLERGVTPRLAEIQAPLEHFESLKGIFEKFLAYEEYITERIDKIAFLAMQEGDHATYQFILWYVEKQIEEEATASDILQRIMLIGDNHPMLFALDAELAARTFTDPFAGLSELKT